MKRIRFLLFMDVMIGFAALAHACFDEGDAAYARDDYAKAYKEFKASADQGMLRPILLIQGLRIDVCP